VSCKEGGGGKNVFCSKKINFDFTVFLYANLPFFKKTNGGKWREHFPAETSHLFYPNRKHYNQKPSKNLNLSKCLHAQGVSRSKIFWCCFTAQSWRLLCSHLS
jgi:hypothetical protein